MSSKVPLFIPSRNLILGDQYELLDALGDGTYGWVWKAQRLEDNAIVAIKIPKEMSKPNDTLEEGKALIGQPSHPNVIEIYWMGRIKPQNEWYAIEMEYFPSQTLADLLETPQPPFTQTYESLFALYDQILAGVQHLHSIGLCHGDLKPQNILISGDRVKLTDFSNSILSNDSLVRSRENGGTILYSAPEFAGVSKRTSSSQKLFLGDIYSLGVLLYQLLTWRLPHGTLMQVVHHDPFPQPREINSSISFQLEQCIMKALMYAPEQRWPNLATMRQAFKKARQAQLHTPSPPQRGGTSHKQVDWSSQVLDWLNRHDYDKAATLANVEFQHHNDPYAYLLLVKAKFHGKRLYDCIRLFEQAWDLVTSDHVVSADLRRIALSVYLITRDFNNAHQILNVSLVKDGRTAQLKLQQASLYGMQARYEEAKTILLELNRSCPKQAPVLQRLAMAYEQLRDTDAAIVFLKAYLAEMPHDVNAQQKLVLLTQLTQNV